MPNGASWRRRLVGLAAAVALLASLSPVGSADVIVGPNDGSVAVALVPTPTPGPPSSGNTVVLAPGDQVTLDVQATVSNSTYGLGSWTFSFGYDSGIVQETACTGGCNTLPSNPVRIAGSTGTGYQNSATPYTLGTITFKALAVGTTTLSIAIPQVTDTQGQGMGSTVGSTEIVVVPPAPTITSIVPDSGPVGGGVSATVYGQNIQNGATVTFGGAPALSYTYNGCNDAIPSVCQSVTVETPANPGVVFGDVNGTGKVSSVDALCILRSVAGLGAVSSCPSAATTTGATVTLTNPDTQSYSASGGFTYWNFDLSASDGGTPDATDALCVLRIVLGMPYTAGCPAPVAPK